jgi:integrase
LLLLLTGLRRSALAGLRWDEVNLEAGTISLSPRACGAKGKGATMALSERALEILRERRDGGKGSVYVFPSAASKTGHIQEAKSAWARICKRAGLVDLRVHDLRRTLGAWLTSVGAPTALTMKALGHSTLAAAQVYQRLDLEPVERRSTGRRNLSRPCRNTGSRERSAGGAI